MVQRLSELTFGVAAAVLGVALLLMFLLWPSVSADHGHTSYFLQTHDLSWLPAFLAYSASLVGIAAGVLLHGVASLTAAPGRWSAVGTLLGRLVLWASTLTLLALAILTGFSIGLVFFPSVAMALLASAIAIVPGSRARPEARGTVRRPAV